MAKHSILEVFEGNEQPFKMLVVGETGSGKTSFLNLLYNCDKVQQLGCNFDEAGIKTFQQFNKSSLENDVTQTMASKTSGTKLYEISFGRIKVGIIDTPGFGDSRGFEQDKKNVETIMDVLKVEHYINCVCLVINGRTPRITVTLRYVLTEITSLMPRQVLDNVVVVFTNSIRRAYVNFDPKLLTSYFGKETQHMFYIDNPYSLYQKFKNEGRDLKTIAEDLEEEFDRAAKVLRKMCEKIHDFPVVHTCRFSELYERKKDIESGVLKLLTEYDNQIGFQNALRLAEQKLRAAQQTKDLFKEFERPAISFWSPEKTSYHNTLCNYKDCRSNCHEHCNLPKSIDKEVFRRCLCMGYDSMCIREKCRHSYTFHYHGYELYTLKEKKSVVDKEMKEKYDAAESEEKKQQVLLGGIKKKLVEIEQKRKLLSAELFKTISKYQELAVLRNYRQLVENQLAVIDTRIKGTEGDELIHLRDTREKLEKKLLQFSNHV